MGGAACTDCAAGKSSASPFTACADCAAGKISAKGAACTDCAAGKSSASPFTACANSAAGKMSAKGAACTDCAAGKYNKVDFTACEDVAGKCAGNKDTATDLAEASTPAGSFQFACGAGYTLKASAITIVLAGSDAAAKKRPVAMLCPEN